MGDVVAIRPRQSAPSSSFLSNDILPDWPHPRRVNLSIEQARAIDRDIRHLDAVMERARDIATISMILSTTCGVDVVPAAHAARAMQRWLSTGRIN